MMQIVAEIVIIGVSEMTMIVMTDEKVDKWIVVIMELKIVVVIFVELALELMLMFMMCVCVRTCVCVHVCVTKCSSDCR